MFSSYLRQLFGYASEHVIVEVPGLSEILDIAGPLVLLAPLLRLHQVPTVRLHGGSEKSDQ